MTSLESQSSSRSTPRDGFDSLPHRPAALLERLQAVPRLLESLSAFGASVMDELDQRALELVALRVGAARDSAYLWSAHAAIAQSLGLTPDEISRVALGPTVFRGHDAAVLWAVDHVLADRPIDRVTKLTLGEHDVVSVLIATQFYETVAHLVRGVGPEPGTPVIPGVETPADARGSALVATAQAPEGVSPLTGRVLPATADIDAARLRNLERGFEERRRLLAGAIGVRDAADLLEVGRQTPHDRRIAGTLVGVKDRGDWRFPTWQFDADGPDGVVAGLVDVLHALRGPISDLGRVRWFLTPKASLHDRAPIDALHDGDIDDVVSEAKALCAS
jgi:alkylhydroperoxidase family enzyme